MTSEIRSIALGLVLGMAALPLAGMTAEERPTPRTAEQVRKQIVKLPFYSIYDHIQFRIDPEGVVTLQGSVYRPTLKKGAERVALNVEGVSAVRNEIEVLPLSSFDDDIRVRLARALYGSSMLNRYSLPAVPPIHLIVNNGHVTLEGVVGFEADKNVAGMIANTVPGVFSVTNNLRVD